MGLRSYQLPHGRRLQAGIRDNGRDVPHLGPNRELRIGLDTLVGHPLKSALAELLGRNPAHEIWPHWVDDLAGQDRR
jgi:hypothetical protein